MHIKCIHTREEIEKGLTVGELREICRVLHRSSFLSTWLWYRVFGPSYQSRLLAAEVEMSLSSLYSRWLRRLPIGARWRQCYVDELVINVSKCECLRLWPIGVDFYTYRLISQSLRFLDRLLERRDLLVEENGGRKWADLVDATFECITHTIHRIVGPSTSENSWCLILIKFLATLRSTVGLGGSDG